MSALSEIREQLRSYSAKANTAWGLISSGFAELDGLLPEGGLRSGTLAEWLASEPGAGATACALRAAQCAMTAGRPLVIVDRDEAFHPPGLGAAVDWPQVLLVHCRTDAEADWATDQAMRTSGVGAVLVRLDRHDDRILRRWQLAAERSGAVGLIVRHLARQPEACFSDVRILVTPQSAAEGRQVRLEILRSRQGGSGAVVPVRLDADENSLPTSATVPTRRRAMGS